MFTHGLAHVEGTITWEKYITAMEENTFDIPMGGVLELQNGDRLGVTSLALNQANIANPSALLSVDGILTLDQVWSNVPANNKK